MKKLYDSMKSDSWLWFRDYGRYDMAQLKLAARNKAKLGENFYSKSDGTRCFYFEQDELSKLMEKVGFQVKDTEYKYRVVENRKENLKMKRVWIQALFYKP
jgi:hypothetical protein